MVQHHRRLFLIIGFFLTFFTLEGFSEECTTGILSGEVTNSGHPLLWKNRDSSFKDNEAAFFSRGGTQFIGIINADDTTQVWAGANNHGFAIMNAESRDMAVPGEETRFDDEGVLMKIALIQCKTVLDFENLLISTNETGRAVTSNFGVIDALGNAAYFETGNHEYFRFDAKQTDEKFLIRANFAYKARSEEGYGKLRHDRAFKLVKELVGAKRLTAQTLISNVTRDFGFSRTSKKADYSTVLMKTVDTISRHRTVAVAVFDGIKPGEDPRFTTFWCTLGEPAVTISVPLWVKSGRVPSVMDSVGFSPLNKRFQELKAFAYHDTSRTNMIDVGCCLKIQQEIDKTQKIIFRQTEKQMKKWRKHSPSPKEVAAFQEKMTELAYRAAKEIQSQYAVWKFTKNDLQRMELSKIGKVIFPMNIAKFAPID